MGELQSVARLKINDGKLGEFKRLAAKCAELVRTKPSRRTGTWFRTRSPEGQRRDSNRPGQCWKRRGSEG